MLKSPCYDLPSALFCLNRRAMVSFGSKTGPLPCVPARLLRSRSAPQSLSYIHPAHELNIWQANTAGQDGGAVATLGWSGALLTLTESTFTNNTARQGGALQCSNGTELSLQARRSCLFTSCGIRCSVSHTTRLRLCRENIRLPPCAQRAVCLYRCLYGPATAIAPSCLVADQSCTDEPTCAQSGVSTFCAAYVEQACVLLLAPYSCFDPQGSTLSGNLAVNGGGAMACTSCGNVTAVTTTFSNNAASDGYGGGVQCVPADCTMQASWPLYLRSSSQRLNLC